MFCKYLKSGSKLKIFGKYLKSGIYNLQSGHQACLVHKPWNWSFKWLSPFSAFDQNKKNFFTNFFFILSVTICLPCCSQSKTHFLAPCWKIEIEPVRAESGALWVHMTWVSSLWGHCWFTVGSRRLHCGFTAVHCGVKETVSLFGCQLLPCQFLSHCAQSTFRI